MNARHLRARPAPLRLGEPREAARTTLAVLDSSDWRSAFIAGNPPKRVEGASCDEKVFDIADVAQVFALREGENEGPHWLVAGVLNDGRYFFLDAGCDNTGWDCQCWGTSWVSDSLARLVLFGLTDEARDVLPGVRVELESGRWP